MSKITPEEVKTLMARMAEELPDAQGIVAGIKRFTPEELAKRMNESDITDLQQSRTSTKPRQKSLSARIGVGIRAANAAGMPNPIVEVDGVKVSAGRPDIHEMTNPWDEVLPK